MLQHLGRQVRGHDDPRALGLVSKMGQDGHDAPHGEGGADGKVIEVQVPILADSLGVIHQPVIKVRRRIDAVLANEPVDARLHVDLAENIVVAQDQKRRRIARRERGPGRLPLNGLRQTLRRLGPGKNTPSGEVERQGDNAERQERAALFEGGPAFGRRRGPRLGDHAVFAQGDGQPYRLVLARTGIEVVQLPPQPVDRHANGRIAGAVKPGVPPEDGDGDLKLLGPDAGGCALREEIEQTVEGVGATQRATGAKALRLRGDHVAAGRTVALGRGDCNLL